MVAAPVEPGFPEEERLRTCSLHRGRSNSRDLGQELSESWTGTYTIPERQMTGFRSEEENLQMRGLCTCFAFGISQCNLLKGEHERKG